MGLLATFGHIAGLYVTVAVFTDFFIKHYVFRPRPGTRSNSTSKSTNGSAISTT